MDNKNLYEYNIQNKEYFPPKTAEECAARIKQGLAEFKKIISEIETDEN